MNYSTNKVQISYMMIWERAYHSSCTVHTTVWLPTIYWAATINFPDYTHSPL